MKTLKIILHYDYVFYILFFLGLIYSISIISLNINMSKYSIKDTTLKGIVISIKKEETYTKLIVKNREKVLVYVYDDITVFLGDYVELIGSFNEISENRNFNLFNYKHYLYSKKIYWIFKVKTINKHIANNNIFYKIKNDLYSNIAKKNNHYLNTFILADNTLIDESYAKNGVMHLFSLSGLHISFFTYYLLNIIKKIFKRSIFNYGLISLILLFYLFISSFSISIVRSFMLFILIFINKTFNLLIKKENILIVIAFIFIIYNPYIIYSIGYWLSFGVTYFVLLLSKHIYKYTNYFIKSLVVSYICFLISLPIIIGNFYSINLLSIFINIVFSMILLIVYPLTLITLVLPNSNALDFITYIMDKLSIFLSMYRLEINLSYLPWWGYIIYYAIIFLVIYKFTIRQYYYGLLVLLILLIHSNINVFNNYHSLHMIDVGQGDSILLQFSHNEGNILFDTGAINSDYTVIPYLNSIGIFELDYLVITHGDLDHAKETINILENIKVNNVLFNEYEDNELELEIIKYLNYHKIKYYQSNLIQLKYLDIDLKFINNLIGDENDNSLVCLASINQYKILLTGDASIKSENSFINKIDKIDILKLGHHGSLTSTSNELINITKPTVSLVSVGLNNRYNHPNNEVLNKLDKYYLTSLSGSVKIVFSKHLDIYTRF